MENRSTASGGFENEAISQSGSTDEELARVPDFGDNYLYIVQAYFIFARIFVTWCADGHKVTNSQSEQLGFLALQIARP